MPNPQAVVRAWIYSADFPWFSPTFYGMRLGQLDILICFLIAILFILPRKWKRLGGGFLLGLGIVLKVSPVLLMPVFVLAFGWQFLAGMWIPILIYAGALITTGLFGQELILFTDQIPYWKCKTNFPTISLYYIVSIQFFPEIFINGDYYNSWLTTLLTVVFLGSYAVIGLWLWWQRAHWFSLFTVGVVMSHLASPFLEPHHYSITLLLLIPWTIFLIRQRAEKHLYFVAVPWFVFLYFLTAYESFHRPEDYLILAELLLLFLPFMYPQFSESEQLNVPEVQEQTEQIPVTA